MCGSFRSSSKRKDFHTHTPLHGARNLAERLKSGERSKNLFREIGLYSIQIFEKDFDRLLDMGCLEMVDGADGKTAVLKDEDRYSDKMGLLLSK